MNLNSNNEVVFQKNNFSKRYQLAKLSLDFADTIAKLRAPDGCPWDKEQTLTSLKSYLIEESYEAIDALNSFDAIPSEKQIKNYYSELGDVLLQVYLNAQVAHDENLFCLNDVISSINKKMIQRHPHVFQKNDSTIQNTDDVLKQWDKIKEKENIDNPKQNDSLLKKALKKRALPTLNFGVEVSKRAKKVGFSWNTLEEVFQDVISEVKELQYEIEQNEKNIEKIEDEIGDVVYALCNVVQFFKETNEGAKHFDFDLIARAAIDKFINRFKEMERICLEMETPLTETSVKNISLEQWNDLWKQAKKRRYR
ncbi:nucleoside triphosphate pyrophosphohydrolase [Silvanigrella paludirubra]|uniref:Nucleoside triphosphate pyrophosphohydrolase n=1 Tax=Silvanigrella paludirubra TaxID=2499159 RepID=A0A6N6VUN3_9BACT|nr:nucleoside triphosphate pyrophosphohydrolase [Silvanigrella paludirubra]